MITLPWISRKEYSKLQEERYRISQNVLALMETIAHQQEQIRALLTLLNNKKQGGEPTTESVAPITQLVGVTEAGRGGWRGKAQRMSQSTFPAPSDSVAQLEEKVRKEGGIA